MADVTLFSQVTKALVLASEPVLFSQVGIEDYLGLIERLMMAVCTLLLL